MESALFHPMKHQTSTEFCLKCIISSLLAVVELCSRIIVLWSFQYFHICQIFFRPSLFLCFYYFMRLLPRYLILNYCVCLVAQSVMSYSLWPHGLYPVKLLSSWNFPGKNTAVGCHFPLQGIVPTLGSNLCFLHWQEDSLLLHHLESPLNYYALLSFI